MVRAVLVVLAALGGLALAGPAARADTLALVDVPGPIEAALRTSLAPWGVAIVVVDPVPATYAPGPLAAERGAAFVAWRRGGELVLYDAALAAEERRPLPAEPDDAGAAAMALSIKTWMGLGPPPGDEPGCGPHGCPRPPPVHHWLVEVASGVRGDGSHQGGAGFRYGLAAGHRRGRFEAGLRLDLGMDTDGTGFGQHGTWSELIVGAWARVGWHVRPGLTVLPGVGIGLVQTGFTAPRTGPGAPGDDASASALALDGEVGARWQRGHLGVAGRVGVTLVPHSQLLHSRSLDELLDAHLEPWLLATVSVDF